MYLFIKCSSIFLLLILLLLISKSNSYKTLCEINEGEVNRSYRHDISGDFPVLYVFQLDPYVIRDPLSVSLRLEASTSKMATLECPLLFMIGQFHETSNFQLPFVFKGTEQLYYSAGKTLCLPLVMDNRFGRNITLRVSTCSRNRFYFDFKLTVSYDLMQMDDQGISTQITPTKSTFYKYLFHPDDDTRIIRLIANSQDTSCMTLSVQDIHCPVYDKEVNVEHEGFWLTMTTKGAMTISRKDFKAGFVVVLVHHHDDSRCSTKPNTSITKPSSRSGVLDPTQGVIYRSKHVQILLRKERDVPLGYFFLALIIPVFCSIIAVAITCLMFQNRHNWLYKITTEKFQRDPFPETFTKYKSSEMSRTMNGRIIETDLDAITEEQLSEVEDFNQDEEQVPIRRVQSIPTHLEKSPVPSPTNPNSIWQWKANLNIASLHRKEHERIVKSSNRFYWTVIIVSVFYAIPVYQLILHYLRVVNRTGEFDICYYNFLCSYRLWIFSDFNHFWSNISYVLFGASFNFIVGRRERNLRLNVLKTKEVSAAEDGTDDVKNICKCTCIPEKFVGCCCAKVIHARIDYGIPLHFGVFYAMGLALIMEGFLSAAYHLCPNQSNFQFDTCFMYVISVLTILKIYQFRHAVHLGANQIFGILAAFVSASVIGLILEVYDSSSTVLGIFRWTFMIGLIISMIVMSVHFYAFGYVKNNDNGKVMASMDVLTNLNQLPRTVQVERLILPSIVLSLSIGVIIYSEVSGIHFATYLLYTLISNVLGTSIYYIAIMKPLHGEFKNWTWVQPVIYFTASMVLGVIAVYYFLTELTKWELSPSASRAINEECTQSWFPFLPFYDNHDIWHFLSAGALFFAFMGLLIVDDDLLTTPQTEIPVF